MEIFKSIGDFVTMYPQVLILLAIWETCFKAVGLWKSSHNNQRYWFITILVVNSLGIVPAIYLKFFQKKTPAQIA